jgi:hypothetical protein
MRRFAYTKRSDSQLSSPTDLSTPDSPVVDLLYLCGPSEELNILDLRDDIPIVLLHYISHTWDSEHISIFISMYHLALTAVDWQRHRYICRDLSLRNRAFY